MNVAPGALVCTGCSGALHCTQLTLAPSVSVARTDPFGSIRSKRLKPLPHATDSLALPAGGSTMQNRISTVNGQMLRSVPGEPART